MEEGTTGGIEEQDESSQAEDVVDNSGETNKNEETHPLKTAFKRRKPANDAEEQCLQFVKDIVQEESCRDIGRHRNIQCKCLHSLREGGVDEGRVQFVASFLFAFGQMDHSTQMMKVTDWCRYAKVGDKLAFILPEIRPKEVAVTNETVYVCSHAIKRLINFGRRKWKVANDHALNGHKYVNQQKGNMNACVSLETMEALRSFFEEMKEMAAPRATRIVREEVGIGLRDEEIELLELPSSFTKRSLYYRFCHSRGWMIKLANARGKLNKTPIPGEAAKDIPSWTSFWRLWKSEYPKLVVCKPREDVCGECYIYANSFR